MRSLTTLLPCLLALVVTLPAAALEVGVAPFERLGAGTPDPSHALARQLAMQGFDRLVPPTEVGVPPTARPRPSQVREWAAAAGVDALVTGRAEPAPDGQGELLISVDVRSAHSGGSRARHQTRAVFPGGLNAAASELVVAILEDLGHQAPAPAAAPTEEEGTGADSTASDADAESDVGETADSEQEDDDDKTLLGEARRDEPISIRSDELEVIQKDETRHLVFRRNVIVVQADVELKTDQLDAIYPDGSSQPDSLVARGNVRVRQGRRRAFCDSATYDREGQSVICTGSAELVQGCDRVRGDEIYFDLEGERVRVTGAPSVIIHPDESQAAEICAEEIS